MISLENGGSQQIVQKPHCNCNERATLKSKHPHPPFWDDKHPDAPPAGRRERSSTRSGGSSSSSGSASSSEMTQLRTKRPPPTSNPALHLTFHSAHGGERAQQEHRSPGGRRGRVASPLVLSHYPADKKQKSSQRNALFIPLTCSHISAQPVVRVSLRVCVCQCARA